MIKINKKILAVGIVLLILGGVLAAVGYMGMMNKSAQSMKEDFNEDKGEYESYDTGDTVKVTGTITNKTESNFMGNSAYGYRLDDVEKWGFLSSEDIGDEGDRVTVTVKYQEGGYWEAKFYSSAMTAPFTLLGLIILIVGVIVAVVGYIKGGKEEEFEEEEFEEEGFDEEMPPEPEPEPEEEF